MFVQAKKEAKKIIVQVFHMAEVMSKLSKRKICIAPQ